MGLIRKTASVSTLGLVKYTSRREAQTRQALAEAKLARAQAKAVRKGIQDAADERLDPRLYKPQPEIERLPVPGVPWYRQPTVAAALLALRQNKDGTSR